MNYKLLPLLLLLLPATGLQAQPGSLDTSFDPGSGPNSVVWTMAVQPDGKILIGGDFTIYNGAPRNRIARLNSDGSLDAGFNPGSGANNDVRAMAVQPDGKILIGGWFTIYNGAPRNYIARLNSDGSLDTGFDPGSGANEFLYVVALQPDGKILIGGEFTIYNGAPRNYIARLNSDGSLDTSFDPGSGSSITVNAIAIQPDGKILIGGHFTSYNGVPRNRIARLNLDGSLDTGFNPSSGASSAVYTVAVQPDGKPLIGGGFTSYNGFPRNRIARLNLDGSLDTGFDPGSGAGSAVLDIAVQPDGKILIGGVFTSHNGASRNRIARLNGGLSSNVTEIDKTEIQLFPNPSTGRFQLTNIRADRVQVYDNTGRLMRYISQPVSELDLSGLPAGVYVLKITEGNAVYSARVVKQ